MNPVIVTDVRYRMALPVIRSLAKLNIPVVALEYTNTPRAKRLGFYSSAIAGIAEAAPPDHESDFIRDISILSRKLETEYGKKPVLIPVGLDTITTVSKHWDSLSLSMHLLTPGTDNVISADDTTCLVEFAKKAGVPVPFTTSLRKDEDITALSGRVPIPCVIKYRRGELLGLKPNMRYIIIKARSNFITEYRRMHLLQEYPLVQEYIKGSGLGVAVVMDNRSQPLASFCHERLREYPASGGPSCFCKSIYAPTLQDAAENLLGQLNWKGLAMVEFKGDPNGDFRLMEINPRFWGSTALSIHAGANIPYALYLASIGKTRQDIVFEAYRDNVKMRFLLQDLASFRQYLELSKDRMHFICEFMTQLIDPRIKHGLFSVNDPVPALRYLINSIKKV